MVLDWRGWWASHSGCITQREGAPYIYWIEPGWVPELVWMLLWREISCLYLESKDKSTLMICLYPLNRTWMGSRTGLDAFMKRNLVPLLGIKSQEHVDDLFWLWLHCSHQDVVPHGWSIATGSLCKDWRGRSARKKIGIVAHSGLLGSPLHCNCTCYIVNPEILGSWKYGCGPPPS